MKHLSVETAELLNKKPTKDFLIAVRQFVKILEDDKVTPKKFYKEAHRALVQLYQTGLELERFELKYSSEEKEFKGIDKDALRELNQNLISNLGKDCFYWEVFDPTYTESDGKPGPGWKITDREPSQGWLVDDFSDIYEDLKVELYKIDKIKTNESIEDALWGFKFSFDHHWGNHCIDAMRALHYLWYDGK